jgi:hypothetical protein
LHLNAPGLAFQGVILGTKYFRALDWRDHGVIDWHNRTMDAAGKMALGVIVAEIGVYRHSNTEIP